jgi:Flp pilus assembly protein protease CpaA
MMVVVVPWIVAMVASATGAVVDLRERRIPNLLTGPVLLAAILWGAWMGGLGGVGNALAGAAIAGVPFILLWLIGGGGAGDAKMMLGVGAWLGPQAGVTALAAVAIAGGLLVIGVSLVKGELGATLLSFLRIMLLLPMVLFGMKRQADRKEMISALAGEGIAGGSGADRSRSMISRVAYGPAIFAGTCAAALWVWWSV